ncbi:UNVERIFIED_CONTAM: 1-aminocyclopropane-1-carboxylate oxidase 5 [Sesamum indicum]
MKEYRAELKKQGHKVMNIMDENLGFPKGYIKNAFDGGVDNTAFFGTKVSHCPPCPHPDKVNALRAHRDAGGVVLLFQDDEIGKGDQLLHSTIHPLKATIQPAPPLLDAKVDNTVNDVAKYPKFVFGDYMSVYLEQKFQPKKPRFQAVAAI